MQTACRRSAEAGVQLAARWGPTHCAQIVETRDDRGITDWGWRVM